MDRRRWAGLKGFLIGADRSGSGKTTLTTGILRSLKRRDISPAPFKCGPDYIDTLHLSKASGNPAHNLDPVMLEPDVLKSIFSIGTHGKEIAVAEGVMGLFDGIRPEGFFGSSYHIAKILRLPVVMVINASSSSYSIAAVLKGFQCMADSVEISGVILNNVASANHEKLLTEAVKMHTGVKIAGCVPRQKDLLASRHLGLKTALETDEKYMNTCADIADSYIDIDYLNTLSAEDQPLRRKPVYSTDKLCLAAFDKAFNFYYDANFIELQKRGYRVEFFSPLKDESVEKADLLYLGGGYPELYARELSGCSSFTTSLRDYSESGRPVIAECGGMMALTGGIHTDEGFHRMSGVFDAECRMMEKRQALGYVRAYNKNYPAGFTGHEFHYSALENVKEPYLFNIEKLTTGKVKEDGFLKRKTFAGYTHFHFMSSPSILDLILE